MLILPYSTELRFNWKSYASYIIIILSLFIFSMQDRNRRAISPILDNYCASISANTENIDPMDVLRNDSRTCRQILGNIHSLPDKTLFSTLFKSSLDEFTDSESAAIIENIQSHYSAFSLLAPASLDARLEYDPASFNPARSLLSALAHADWWHLIGNIIFFFAFAPAIELIIGNALKFILVIILIEFSCDIVYTAVILSSGAPIPSLGLSGVVTGMIGLAGYLMPRANIRTLFWFLVYVRIVPIPVWILALWYIGWDSFYLFSQTDSGGVNLVAHVTGGVTGYLIGMFWFRDRKTDISDELNDEIEYARARRIDKFSTISTYKGDKKRIDNEFRAHDARKEYNEYSSQVYQYMRTGRDSDAIVLFLKDHDLYSQDCTIYEELFNETRHGRAGRSLLCLGRLCIDLLVTKNYYPRALDITQECLGLNENFVLSDSANLIPLTKKAIEFERYDLAYQIIKNASQRYDIHVDGVQCRILEAQILIRYLGQHEQSRIIVSELLRLEPGHQSHEIFSLAAELNNTVSPSS